MTGREAIIIPFRSLADGKSRLSPVLDPLERARINREMLERVLHAAQHVSTLPGILVVSPDESALELVRDTAPAAVCVAQPPENPGLNPALELATQLAVEAGARVTIIVPADLPLLRTTDLENLMRRDAPVVIAPDRMRQGTNGLMQRIDATGGKFRYQFGPNSYHHHQEEAHRLGLDAVTAVSLGTSFDLDTPEDLGELTELERSRHVLRERTLTHG